MFLNLIANKIVIGILVTLVGAPPIIYGGIKANDYRQTQTLLQEARQLSSGGDYQEAVSKLIATESKWSPSGTKEEVQLAIADNKQLIESSKTYALGKEMFDKGNYKDARELLKRIESRNINYSSARSLVELAEKKIADIPKGEVAGVKTEVKKVVKASTPVLPTSTPTPITPTPTSEPRVDVTAICNAKKQQMAGTIADSAYRASAQAEANSKSDPMFYQVWMSMQPNIQTMTKSWTVKTLGEYEVYCLTHNGTDSGWGPSSGPFDGIKW